MIFIKSQTDIKIQRNIQTIDGENHHLNFTEICQFPHNSWSELLKWNQNYHLIISKFLQDIMCIYSKFYSLLQIVIYLEISLCIAGECNATYSLGTPKKRYMGFLGGRTSHATNDIYYYT